MVDSMLGEGIEIYRYVDDDSFCVICHVSICRSLGRVRELVCGVNTTHVRAACLRCLLSLMRLVRLRRLFRAQRTEHLSFSLHPNARSSIMNKTAEQQKDRIVCRVNEVAAQA